MNAKRVWGRHEPYASLSTIYTRHKSPYRGSLPNSSISFCVVELRKLLPACIFRSSKGNNTRSICFDGLAQDWMAANEYSIFPPYQEVREPIKRMPICSSS